jgi:alkanesulfonate monooxygenase
MSPTVAARMASTLDRVSNGRLLVNVVTGGDPVELAGEGSFLDHDARYDLTDEFLTIWRKTLEGEKLDFKGEYLQVEGAEILYPPIQKPYPPLYFGGSSPAGMNVAADHVDVYLTWGEPPVQVEEKIKKMQKLAKTCCGKGKETAVWYQTPCYCTRNGICCMASCGRIDSICR